MRYTHIRTTTGRLPLDVAIKNSNKEIIQPAVRRKNEVLILEKKKKKKVNGKKRSYLAPPEREISEKNKTPVNIMGTAATPLMSLSQQKSPLNRGTAAEPLSFFSHEKGTTHLTLLLSGGLLMIILS